MMKGTGGKTAKTRAITAETYLRQIHPAVMRQMDLATAGINGKAIFATREANRVHQGRMANAGKREHAENAL